VDHGIIIEGYNVQLATKYTSFSGTANSLEEFLNNEDKSALEAHAVTFTANKAGSFSIICLVVCSYGHSYMIAENGLVVTG
jgi:hypothetical protein